VALEKTCKMTQMVYTPVAVSVNIHTMSTVNAINIVIYYNAGWMLKSVSADE